MTVECISLVAQDDEGSAAAANRPLPQPVEKVIAMGKGHGEQSYSRNSSAQAHRVREFALPHLDRALERVDLSSAAGPIVVADLGCSSGPNTINHVSFIVDKLLSRIRSAADAAATPPLIPEFQAYFCDLPQNDFNTLFQFLTQDSRIGSSSGSKFFASGVPGSFYGRLFCRSSVHVFFSAVALHWMSNIPDALLDKESPAFNKGTIWIEDSHPAVGKAFQEQAMSDMKNFLQARAVELAPGGLLFFFCTGRNSDDLHDELSLPLWSYMDDILATLIEEGVLTEEQRDNMNIPIYRRTREEMAEALQSVESFFDVALNTLNRRQLNFLLFWPNATPSELGRILIGHFRAGLGGLMEAQIGKEASDIFWLRYEEWIKKEAVPHILRNPELGNLYHHIVALVRK